ncbi:MAG: RNA polymerase sigma factor [Planctomycetota bacterium]
MNEDSEKKLVAACRNGDKSTYAKLVKCYSGRIFAICLGMLGNREDAEDIAQQVLVKGLTNIRQLRDNEQFGAWIARIAKNLCIDFIRKQKHKQNRLIEPTTTSQSSSKEHPELQAALAMLSEEHRLALMLFYFDGHSTRSIARMLMISEAAAQARLSRARKQLRRLLKAAGGT